MKVEYEKNVSAEEFREQLYSRRNKDISSGTTTAGPHRDDLRFKVGGIDIRKFGSQGQQRTAALSLKLSEIRLIEQVRTFLALRTASPVTAVFKVAVIFHEVYILISVQNISDIFLLFCGQFSL